MAKMAEADRFGQVRYEARMIRKDGSLFPIQMDLVSVRDEGGQLLYRVGTVQDISERNARNKSCSTASCGSGRWAIISPTVPSTSTRATPMAVPGSFT